MERKDLFQEVYLAYFDLLGFKEFILNNDDETLVRAMGNIFRDIEHGIAKESPKEERDGVLFADMSDSKLNFLNISDSMVYWTKEQNNDQLIELVSVVNDFNWRMIVYNFPIRGVLMKGKIRLESFKSTSKHDAQFQVSCMYGQGVVNAYSKADAMDWAGTVIDNSIVEILKSFDAGSRLLDETCIPYQVPYKLGMYPGIGREYSFKLIQGGMINSRHFENRSDLIRGSFSRFNKSIEVESVKRKLQNTIDFLAVFHDPSIPMSNT